ncbi:2-phosphosulfolactate phosphatase [Desertibacillus haloalkaliphilus]|nr:2-phosphosulfolactate phosphatase [Desertibacillus haloalkaliphilus]
MNIEKSILVVCSGSSGRFNVEDFYGAGYFIHHLLEGAVAEYSLTDAAQAALGFYQGNVHRGKKIIEESEVGRKLLTSIYKTDMSYVLQHGVISNLPYLHGKRMIVCEAKEKATLN